MSEEMVKVEGSKGGGWAKIFPSSCPSYGEARRGNLPRALIYKEYKGKDCWAGEALSCETSDVAVSAESYEEACVKAVDIVQKALRALEEKKS